MFVANAKAIPPLGMPVRLVLTPKLDEGDRNGEVKPTAAK